MRPRVNPGLRLSESRVGNQSGTTIGGVGGGPTEQSASPPSLSSTRGWGRRRPSSRAFVPLSADAPSGGGDADGLGVPSDPCEPGAAACGRTEASASPHSLVLAALRARVPSKRGAPVGPLSASPAQPRREPLLRGSHGAQRQLLCFRVRPQIRRDNPLNLSISVSGGKETNQDSLSSGERRGKSPAPNPRPPSRAREMWRTEDRFPGVGVGA